MADPAGCYKQKLLADLHQEAANSNFSDPEDPDDDLDAAGSSRENIVNFSERNRTCNPVLEVPTAGRTLASNITSLCELSRVNMPTSK